LIQLLQNEQGRNFLPHSVADIVPQRSFTSKRQNECRHRYYFLR